MQEDLTGAEMDDEDLKKVNQALKALKPLGKLSRQQAEQVLTMWSGYRSLTGLHVSEILKRYRA